jgi:serine/threonine protein kinase/Tfp pilus assembly protein PilF
MMLGLEPGAMFGGRYRIESLLGEGGMGAVYKAYDAELDRLVALKLLRPGLMMDQEALQRLKQELLLASKISHKNILRIHDLGDAGGTKFISMAFVEGDDLHRLVRKQGRLPVERALRLMRQLCAALDAAHAEGVLHRDLKPQNILVDASDAAFVSDFGLAKSLDASTAGMTRAGELLGTPRYMSPEQVQGGKLDHRSDLYSLGLIFYEMLTGDVPFTGDSTLQLMFQRVKEKPKDPKLLNPDLPDYLSRVIMRCLERDPKKRYQNAREILADLEAHHATSGSTTVQITLPVSEERKKPFLIGLGVVVLLLLSLAIPQVRHAIFGRPEPAATEEHTPVKMLVADFENATGESIFDSTLEPAFSIAVEGASFINLYHRGEALRLAGELQPGASRLNEGAARLVAVREGISAITFGAIRKDGGKYRLELQVIDGITGNPLFKDETTADNKEAVLKAVSKLAAHVRTALGDATPESLQLAAAETFTSSSLEAAQQFAQGQKMQHAGKYDEALPRFLKATELDPDLGRAYAAIATIHANEGRMSEADKFFKMAFSKIDRMSDREKYRTRGLYYLFFRNPDKAIEELDQLVTKFPSDSAGWTNLALAHSFRRDFPRALEVGKRALELNPKDVIDRSNVGIYAMYAGDFEEAIREQRAVLETNPAFVKSYLSLGLSQLGLGQAVEAKATYEKLAKQDPTAYLALGDLALFEGRAADATSALEQGVAEDLKNKDNDNAASKLVVLGEAYLQAGQQAKAVAAVDRALGLSKQDAVLFWGARVYLAAGREPKALAIAQELGQRLEPEPQAFGKLIEGEVQLKRGKTREALALFADSRKLTDTWLARFDLGRAYLEAASFPEAYNELETCVKRRGEATALFLDEVPSYRIFPPVYYYLGRAQEGLKSPAAAESYKKFLALKKDGAGDPLVADARRRLGNR